MSLINRMLGDLAARQAPGTEALSGVRLNEPLAEASASLSMRTVQLTVGAAVGAAMLVWWLWSPPGIPVPQPRGIAASADTATLAEPRLLAEASFAEAAPLAEATAAEEAAAPAEMASPAAVPANLPRGMSLRLDARVLAPPARVAGSAPHSPADRPAALSASRPTKGRSTERVSPGPATPVVDAVDAVPALPSATGENAETGPAATAANNAPDFAARKREARDSLAHGEPGAALSSLEGAPDDTDALSLRAAALQRLGRHDEAASTYRRLTASDASEAGHWVGLAISLEGLERRDEARAAYRRALESSRLARPLQQFAQQRLAAPEAP